MTPPGARWITVHPNGPDEEGRPVLIKDDGSGTVLGGMGGTFNGQKLGALYHKEDETKPAEEREPPKAQPEPEPPEAEPEPTSEEAHPKYNPHLPDYEDFGPELQAQVYGKPEHGGEGQGWRFHLRNPHLAAMSKQGYGALPGGLLLPHPEGGVVYHQRPEVGDPGDYESALHSMAQDVAGQIHEHLGRAHERRMLDEEQKAYQEETERELAAWKRDQMAGVRKAIASFGGIARFAQKDAKGRRYMDAEYNDYVPRWARNQSGLTPDRARAALNAEFPHLGLETPSDLFDYLDQFEDEKAAFKEQQAGVRAKRADLAAQKKVEREQARAAREAPHHDPQFDKYAAIALRRVWGAPPGAHSRREFGKAYGPEVIGHLVTEGLLRDEGGKLGLTAAGREVAAGHVPVPPRRGPHDPYVLPAERPNLAPTYDPADSHTRRYADSLDAKADIQDYFEGRDAAKGKMGRTVKPTVTFHEYEHEGEGDEKKPVRVQSHHWGGEAVTARERPNGHMVVTFPTPNPYGSGDMSEEETRGAWRRRAQRQADDANERHGEIAYLRGSDPKQPALLDHPDAQEQAARSGLTDEEGQAYHPERHVVVQPYANARAGFLLPSHIIPRDEKHYQYDVKTSYGVPEELDKARRKYTAAGARQRAMAAAREGDTEQMPYDSNDDLPDAVRKLSAHQQTVFRKAWNAAHEQYGSEKKAYAVAWAAAQKAGDGDDEDSAAREAALTAKRRDDLDEDQFAFPPDKLPIHDAAHVRNAIARFNQTQGMSAEEKKAAWARIRRAAKRHGVEVADDEDETDSREVAHGWAAPSAGQLNQERPVRESTVQSARVRENIVREGRGYRIRDCQIMAAGSGNALMGNTYLPQAVEALVREVQRQPKSYVDHSIPSEVQARGHRSLRDLAGVYDKRTVRYDPTAQACLADLIVRPSVYDEYVAPVLEAGDNLGISVDGIGHCPDRPRHVKGWKRFNSADLVPAGGARGFIVREANSAAEKAAERDFSMAVLEDITAADVRETAPALYEEIGRHYQAAHPATGTLPGGSPPSAAPDDGRLNALESRVREAEQRAEAADARVYELEAERNRAAVAAFVDATVRECGLTEDRQAQFVAKGFAGATMGLDGTYPDQETLEAAVREAAEEFLAVLPATPTGQIVGLGSGTGGSGHGSKFTAPAQAQNKAILTATDWLFGVPSILPNGPPVGAAAPHSQGANGTGS